MKAQHLISLILILATTNVFTLAFVILPICAGVPLTGLRRSEAKLQVIGKLSPDDIAQILNVVRQYNMARSWTQTAVHPIKSIEVTTNGTVDVWFAAKEWMWGEGGNRLEKGNDGWKITTELFIP